MFYKLKSSVDVERKSIEGIVLFKNKWVELSATDFGVFNDIVESSEVRSVISPEPKPEPKPKSKPRKKKSKDENVKKSLEDELNIEEEIKGDDNADTNIESDSKEMQ